MSFLELATMNAELKKNAGGGVMSEVEYDRRVEDARARYDWVK